MKTSFFLFLLVSIVSCSLKDNDSFKRTASGLEFKIIPGGNKGPMAGSGATVKINYTWYRHDTAWIDSRKSKPFYQALIPGVLFPYDPFETLVYGVRENDSVVVHLRVDSLLNQHRLDSLPPGTNKNDVWTVGIKVLKIFPFDPLKGDSIIRADQLAENKKYESLHPQSIRLTDSLKSHK